MNNRCKVLLAVYLVLARFALNAEPANPLPLKVVQADGTSLTVKLVGDEFLHYYLTLDSIVVIRDDNGCYYADVEDGILVPSSMLAHEPMLRTSTEKRFCESRRARVEESLNALRQTVLNSEELNHTRRIKPGKTLGERGKYVGQKKGLVILVEFDNLAMKKTSANQDFSRMFNSVGYSENGCIGSVHDYFYDQSYGQFDLTFDVVGPVKVSRDYWYYGANNAITGNDKNANDMVVEACRLADEYVDYSDYDWDDDGTTDQVFLIYAGYAESSGAASNTIWPHKSSIERDSLELDGVAIKEYACSSELRGRSGSNYDGIGTACHEFSHCLGIPDLYDVDYHGGFGMGQFDIMSSGGHSGPEMEGEVPYGYSAYERWLAGWLEFTEISSPTHVAGLKNIADKPVSYLVFNEGHRDEFLIIENHGNDRWFSYVGSDCSGHGLLITHVDYDSKLWQSNAINTRPDHQRMSYIPAGGFIDMDKSNALSDLFPGSTNQTFLDSRSHTECGGRYFNPNSKGKYELDRLVRNISESEHNTVSFDVVFMDMYAPDAKSPSTNDSEGFEARWTKVIGADSYMVSYRTIHSFVPFLITSETINIDNSTSVKIKWGRPSIFSTFEVKALCDGFESDWSNQIKVYYPTSTSIDHPGESIDLNSPYYNTSGTATEWIGRGVIIKDGKKFLIK